MYSSTKRISIHAPTKGATGSAELKTYVLQISIHAPTKGATLEPSQIQQLYFISIHAPTKGATDSEEVDANFSLFQSTLPRRERLPALLHSADVKAISIHAPTKGATILPFVLHIWSGISIHAPTKGATYYLSRQILG